ncbi:MAG TPA: discoidin domain-containing protein, partial [Kofleriaceae bacterium]|nr:discoidin domain-containing protein [Kofleriaceae bacterium]
EWVALELERARPVSGVTLYPRTDTGKAGMGFPIDFAIQTWDGAAWVDRVTRTAFPRPDAPQTFTFTPVTTSKIRILGTRLESVPADDYVMQFAEISVL